MNGNDLLNYDMMLAHQQRLLDEAERLRLPRELGRRARRGRGVKGAAGSHAVTGPRAGRPVKAPRRRVVSAYAPEHAPRHANGSAPGHAIGHAGGHTNRTVRRRFGGVADRIGATLVTLGTRLQRLEHGPDRGV